MKFSDFGKIYSISKIFLASPAADDFDTDTVALKLINIHSEIVRE